MKRWWRPEHPALYLSAYLLVPLAVDLVTAQYLHKLLPQGSVFVLRASGLLVAISWGSTGLLFCMLLGLLCGLPVALMQIAYLRSRLELVAAGEEVSVALRTNPWIAQLPPWLFAAGIAYLLGRLWVFAPQGGILMAVNVLWARTLVYRAHLLVYEYRRADAELRAEEQRPAGTLSHSA